MNAGFRRLKAKKVFMKKNYLALCNAFLALGVISSGWVAAPPTARAQPVVGGVYAPPPPPYNSPWSSWHAQNGLGFYLAGDTGLSIMQDFNSSRFGFPGRFSTDVGGRFSLEPGFDFIATHVFTLGAEFETGVVYNYIHRVTEAGVGDLGLHGDYYQVPFMGNLVLKFCPDSPVTFYIGGGGGGLYSNARLRPYGSYDDWVHSDETDPAVQAMAGVRFKLGPFAELGLGYKFLAALVGDDNNVYTHAVLASFSLNF